MLQTAAQAGVSNQEPDVQIHEDLSDHVASTTDLQTGQTVNMLKLPGKPIYKTDPGWVHAEDALPMQVLLDKAAVADPLLASNTLAQVLSRESVVKRFNEDTRRWISGAEFGVSRGQFRHVGGLKPDLVKRLDLDSAVITFRENKISHNIRDAVPDLKKPKSGWIDDIALHLSGEYRVFRQVKNGNLLLIFNGDQFNDQGKVIKLVLQPAYKASGRNALDVRVKKFTSNAVITTGFEFIDNLVKSVKFEEIK